MTLRLSGLVTSEGYTFVVDPEPWRRPDVVGDPPDPHCFSALLCDDGSKRYIACKADSWDFAYDCSHEIAEDQYGHTHGELLFSGQANILARWVKALASEVQRAEQGSLEVVAMYDSYGIMPWHAS